MASFRSILYHARFLATICACLIWSCVQHNPKQTVAGDEGAPLKPPAIIAVTKPIIVSLDTCPPPRTSIIPDINGGSFIANKKDSQKAIHAPEIIPANFYIPVQTYKTSNGLPLNAVISSCVDRKGNLWFGTQGSGVSRYDGKSFVNYSKLHGLASNNVISILEDKKGNLWFGTFSGISCYDGKSFTNYTTAQGLIDDIIPSILQDKGDNFWFGTRNGVSKLKFDKSTLRSNAIFTSYSIADGLAANNVTCMMEDKKGNIWFGTVGGLSRYNGKTFVNYTAAEGLADDAVSSITEDKNGNLWVGTQNGMSRFDGTHFTNYTTIHGLASNNVLSSMKDKGDNLWIGTAGGVSLYDEKSSPGSKTNFINYTTMNGLPNNRIKSIVEDKGGNIWFTSTDGVFRLDRNWRFMAGDKAAFTAYMLTHEVANNSVTSIVEDSKNNLWFGTLGAGVLRFNQNEKTFTTYTTAQGLPNDVVQGIAEDSQGNLWFATPSGISRLDKNWKYLTTYTTAQGLANEAATTVIEDNSGNLWFGTRGGGVSMLDKDWKTFTTYSTTQGLPHNLVRNIAEDNDGNLWFGTLGGGLSKLDKDRQTFTNYSIANGLITDYVWNVFADNDENIWVGTEVGIIRFDGEKFTTYSNAAGLGDNGIDDILLDKHGTIWIGTNNGFSALKGFARAGKSSSGGNYFPASTPLSNLELTGNADPVFEVYNVNTGYPLNDINMNGMAITRGEIIWAGTSDKLVRLDYNALYKNPSPPNVFIQRIRINNENIPWYDIQLGEEPTDSLNTSPNIVEQISTFGKVLDEIQIHTIRTTFGDLQFDSVASFYALPLGLVLPYRHNNITFDFAAIEPAKPQLVKYQYMLGGYDKDWSPATNQTSAGFGNIREGSYSFKLRAQSPDGVWSNPSIYTFKVLPPWYRTWWAYSLYVLAFLSIALMMFKWRIKSLEREKSVLEHSIALRTHQLKGEKEKVESTLLELKATQTQLIQSEKMASLGELSAGIAHEIQNPLNFVNNFSEVSNELIDEMKDELSKGNYKDANTIADDVKQNLEKINHHGKRADAIVKGMLQHSRANSGTKEPSDINALCDEYLRLTYHGLRAKDKSFNATMNTDFDISIKSIDIIPQDIARVIMNLLTNAFYAVNEKNASLREDGHSYEPTVSISTKRVDDKIEIKVSDNGKGIPKNVLDKIFNPFFTTKPTGHGTGLGLSLSYDIIKAHGGEIRAKTKDGEGAEFIIKLPNRPN